MPAGLERWAEHFEEVLVQEALANPIEENEVETDEIFEMDTTEIKEGEVRQALRKSKSGRTPGIDGIPAELYRADSEVAARELTRLFNRLWREEKIPDQWKKGLTVKTREFERVQELARCDIVTCGKQSNGESHHREKNTKRSRSCT